MSKDVKILTYNDLAALLTAAENSAATGGGHNTAKQPLSKWSIVTFTKQEVNTMPKTFRRLFLIQGKRCHIRTRKSGKDSVTYEIRYRSNGFNISASGKTVELAKANFIEKLKAAALTPSGTTPDNGEQTTPQTFNAFATYYFETFRREKVTATTYKFDVMRYRNHILPHLQERPIKKITPLDCKTILDGIKTQGKYKTADEVRAILSVIFKSAIAHGIIDKSPIDVVPHIQHERESGTALTKAEEDTLLSAIKGTRYELAAALTLFCGLRPNELKTAKQDGLFIIAVNSKRKGKKVEYKRIPIIRRLRALLPDDEPFYIPDLNKLRAKIREILPAHKLYDLRTTFYTRCDEMGVLPPARDEFVGHSNGTLTNAYRDLSDDFLLKEGAKLDFW